MQQRGNAAAPDHVAGAHDREAQLAEKDNLISSLKDIEMDRRMEKLSDRDYQKLKAECQDCKNHNLVDQVDAIAVAAK